MPKVGDIHVGSAEFQSAPGREAGRCQVRNVNATTAEEVSIRARP